jgi:hypothetical protein
MHWLLFAAALPALAGEPHTVSVSVANARAAHAKSVAVETGGQGNFSGDANGKMLIANISLAQDDKAGPLTVSFQVELSAHKRTAGLAGKTQANAGDSFQAQGVVNMKPGMAFTTVQCGGWNVTLGLDVPAKGAPKADWDAAGLENARLTLEGPARKCVRVAQLGTQSNIVEARAGRGTSKSFVFNDTLAREGKGFTDSFQVDDGIGGYAGAFQSSINLSDKRKSAAGPWSFTVEAPKPAPPKKEEQAAGDAGAQAGAQASGGTAAPAAAPKKEAPPDAITPGVVPMLR